MTQSCLGGWCTKRDHCANYHAASPDQTPSERLFPPGQDGAGPSHPLDDAMTRYLNQATQERIVSILPQQGLPIREITVQTGAHIANVRTTVSMMAERQALHITRAGTGLLGKPEVWCFRSQEDRDRFAADQIKAAEERQRERDRHRADLRKEERRVASINAERNAISLAAQKREDAKSEAKKEKPIRPRGDKQLRTDDRFDTARAVNEAAASLKNSNRSRHVPSADDEAKTTRYPTPPGRYAPNGAVPRVFQNSDSMPVSAWARAVAP